MTFMVKKNPFIYIKCIFLTKERKKKNNNFDSNMKHIFQYPFEGHQGH